MRKPTEALRTGNSYECHVYTLQTYSTSAVIMRKKLLAATLELRWRVGQTSVPCKSFVSTTLIFPCYNVVLRKSQKWAGINQPRKQISNTKQVQVIGYLSHNPQIFILQIPNEPNGNAGHLISINWQQNQPETTTKGHKIRSVHHKSTELHKCVTKHQKFYTVRDSFSSRHCGCTSVAVFCLSDNL